MTESVEPPPLPPGRSLRLPGRGTTFVREMAGPPGAPTVILLHGWTVTADLNWFPSYGPLARRFRVLALDQRGHGRGIRSWRPFRLEDCADDVAALLRATDTDRAIVVGYSMGGPVAQLAWRRHPEVVEGLVLCATSARFVRDPRDRLLFAGLLGLSVAARLTPSVVSRQVSGSFTRRRLDGTRFSWAAAELDRNDPAAVLQAGSAIGSYDARAWIEKIDVPTAVVVTAEDRFVDPRYQAALARSIPGATLHQVLGDHGVCAIRPQRFVPTLVEACELVAHRAGQPAPAL
jgi:pimeloyl-ACP methyl ester carboxylesterase